MERRRVFIDPIPGGVQEHGVGSDGKRAPEFC
jgi:hypothetical protein